MIILNIGSNLKSKYGNRLDNINKAILFLKKEDIKIIKKSYLYETPSYPNNDCPKFINLCVSISFVGEPLKLLNIIHGIEKKMERIRDVKNEPRTCDIDIIDFNSEIVNLENIILPHKRAHLRNFVLYPLKDIFPNWVHPINNMKIDDLIRKIPSKLRNEITRLKESDILAS